MADPLEQALAALRDLFALVEDGTLVRDVSRDDEHGWPLRAMKMVMTLKAAKEAIDAPAPSRDARLEAAEALAEALRTYSYRDSKGRSRVALTLVPESLRVGQLLDAYYDAAGSPETERGPSDA